MANSYVYLGEVMKRRDQSRSAERVFALSTDIHAGPAAYKHLADLAFSRGEHARAVDYAERTLELDPAQPAVHAFAAEVAAAIIGDPARARRHVARAVELDPTLEPGLERLLQASGP